MGAAKNPFWKASEYTLFALNFPWVVLTPPGIVLLIVLIFKYLCFVFECIIGFLEILMTGVLIHSIENGVDFKIVQLFTANIFSVKEHKRYNGKYTHYIEIFPLETQTGKTNIFYIHSHHTLFIIQYTYMSQQHPKP
jgi:hypothetical protein